MKLSKGNRRARKENKNCRYQRESIIPYSFRSLDRIYNIPEGTRSKVAYGSKDDIDIFHYWVLSSLIDFIIFSKDYTNIYGEE